MGTLSGRIAVVAGATRGAGRGIARMLGEARATVYCSGRSVRGAPATGNRPETPGYVGRAVAALAADPGVAAKSGKAFASWNLAREYGFTDVDGRQPSWEGFIRRSMEEILARGGAADERERRWLNTWTPYKDEPGWSDLIARVEAALSAQPN